MAGRHSVQSAVRGGDIIYCLMWDTGGGETGRHDRDCSVPIVIWLFHWLESVILHVFMRLCDIVNKKVSKCRVKREIGGHCGGVYCNVPPACTWEPASTCPGLQRAAARITWGKPDLELWSLNKWTKKLCMERFFLMAELKMLSADYALCITKSVKGRISLC